MEISAAFTKHLDEIAGLFAATFAASEGAEEGALIGELARRLMLDTPAEDLRVFTAWEDGVLAGCILFTRLSFEGDPRKVFMLAPVAVATARQGEGIGQRLITHGLDALRHEGVEIVVTYGDPNFYGRVGFKPVSVDALPAPFALQQPEGWQCQSLCDAPFRPFAGPVRCVEAFNDPVFW